MPKSEAKRKADKKWHKANMKSIGVCLRIAKIQTIEALAKKQGVSRDAWVKAAINEKLEKESKDGKMLNLEDLEEVANIEVYGPKLAANESTAICSIGKHFKEKCFYVSIDFHSTGYRLSSLGQQFFLNVVGYNATKTSAKAFSDHLDGDSGKCFSTINFAKKEDAVFAFFMVKFIPKVPSFLMDDANYRQ